MSTSKAHKKSFREVIESTPDVRNGYKCGLEALGNDSKRIKIPSNVIIDGSLDIDINTKHYYPNDHRWDYAICCDGSIFYIEVHSAVTSEVTTVLKKLYWLKTWISNKAPEFALLTNFKISPFYWIQSSSFQIPKHFPQYRMAMEKKLLPIKEWDYAKIIKNSI